MYIFQLLNAVGQVRQAVQIKPELPPLPDINSLDLGKDFLIGLGVGAFIIITYVERTFNIFKLTHSNFRFRIYTKPLLC